MKTYYNSVKFCNIYVMRSPGYCEALQFVDGRLDTEDPAVIEHLNAICDKPGHTVTSKSSDYVDPAVVTAKADARKAAEIAQTKMVAAGEKTA